MQGTTVQPSGLTDTRLLVRKTGNDRGRYVEMYSSASSNVEWYIPNNSIVNLSEGVLKRVLLEKQADGYAPLPPLTSGALACLSQFRAQLVKRVVPTPIRSREAVVASYTGRKRQRYQRALDTLAVRKPKASDSYIGAFLKLEKSKKDFVPRIVSPRKPTFNLQLLQHLQEMEHKIYYAHTDLFGDVTIFKGLNAQEQGEAIHRKWSRFTSPVAVGFDASKFDQHVRKEMLQYEHSIYLACVSRHNRANLRWLLEQQLVNKVRGNARDGWLRYTVQGSRMSGDVNTSLGNCIIMCAMVWSFCRSRGILKFELCNNGDDCVLIVEKSQLHLVGGFAEYAGRLGFPMVVEKPVYVLEQIEFCQTHPVLVDGSYVMCRDPMKSMSKDVITLIPLHAVKPRKRWVKNVGEAGLSLTGGIPVMQSFYQCLIRSAGNVKRLADKQQDRGGLFWLSKRMSRHASIPSTETRFSFWRAFGIDPAMQMQLETYYDNLLIGFDTEAGPALRQCWC